MEKNFSFSCGYYSRDVQLARILLVLKKMRSKKEEEKAAVISKKKLYCS